MLTAIILIAISALIGGIALVCFPARVIEFQRQFYLLINWRIEPVDMRKELNNTRGMGVSLIVCVIVLIIYAFVSGMLL